MPIATSDKPETRYERAGSSDDAANENVLLESSEDPERAILYLHEPHSENIQSKPPAAKTSRVTLMPRFLSHNLQKKVMNPKVSSEDGRQKVTINYSGSSVHPQLSLVDRELGPDQPMSIISIRPELIELGPAEPCRACEDTDQLDIDENTMDSYRTTDPEEDAHALVATAVESDEDLTFEVAMKRNDKNRWVAAMKDELRSLDENKVWSLVDRPAGKNIVSNKWVLRVKRNPDGSVERYKARLVARGFSQRQGVDYTETYAPVASLVIIRMLFALSVVRNWSTFGFDIKTAFLYGSLDTDIYMEQPRGFETDSRVCKLKRSIYGLKQSPRMWNERFTACLKSCGLTPIDSEPCVFRADSAELVVCIYVDDGLIFTRDPAEAHKLLRKLKKEFDMREILVDKYLGMQIKRSEQSLVIHQEAYIKSLLKKFNLAECNPAATPMSLGYDGRSQALFDDELLYRRAVGSLLYAAVTSRIDIMHAVSKLSRKVSCPTRDDWTAVKRVMRYLKGRESYGIRFDQAAGATMTLCQCFLLF